MAQGTDKHCPARLQRLRWLQHPPNPQSCELQNAWQTLVRNTEEVKTSNRYLKKISLSLSLICDLNIACDYIYSIFLKHSLHFPCCQGAIFVNTPKVRSPRGSTSNSWDVGFCTSLDWNDRVFPRLAFFDIQKKKHPNAKSVTLALRGWGIKKN